MHAKDSSGQTALQWSAVRGALPAAETLLRAGAQPNQKDHKGYGVQQDYSLNKIIAVTFPCLSETFNCFCHVSENMKVCHVAAQYGQTAIIYHLALRWNVDVCDVDGDGRTPLHWAAYKGFADTVRLLLVLNAEYALPDREGTAFPLPFY